MEGMKVYMKDDKIRVENNGISFDFTKAEFNRRPRWVMDRITRIIT